ncbi:MAG: hypothetical protein V5A55_07545 [Halovenus sp.]
MDFLFTLHPQAEWVDGTYSLFLHLALFLAGLGTTMLFLIGVFAYRQRRTFRYLLLALSLALLVGRTVVGFGTILGVVPMTVHHLVAHGFDFLLAVLILYAVYQTGPVRERISAD